MENHGIDVKRRRDLVREKMLAMQALWANDVAEFHGELLEMAPAWQWPKPIQQPRPPILIGGGAGPKLFAHIAEYADGWMPIGGAGMRESVGRLREAMAERGRDPNALRIAPMGVLPDEAKLAYYQETGATEAILRLPSASREKVLPRLDEFTQYLEIF
jgi:alkanesulfonate monooxygenase SsuD/methylene tetrahydromethanopterin reductase-like flavin-dependent oxidoreductase (luciferase family)